LRRARGAPTLTRMRSPRTPAGFFSVEEILLPPNLLSLLRLPLAVLFPLVAGSRNKALLILALAGLTDVLDGYLARHDRQVTATGAVIDPVADKLFALSVVGTLLAQGKIPRWGVPALLAREILEAPLLLWVVLRPREASDAPVEVRSMAPGKLATVAQFAAVMAAIELPAAVPAALVAAALTGTVAGVFYWRRELGRR
jgi:cardiolipin synthase